MSMPGSVVATLAPLIGLVVGSFVNLVAQRLPEGRSVAWARSRADCCEAVLSPRELIPVISWLIQRGRCRRCGSRLTVRHPLVELAGSGVGVWAALTSATLPELVFTTLLGWQLLLIALVDADELWLPDQLTFPLLASGLVAAVWLPDRTLLEASLGVALGFTALWTIAGIYRRLRARDGLGGGDPILFGSVGAWVGWSGLPSVLLWASAAGLCWVLARRLAGRAVGPDEPLPFGPFIVAGGWLTWLYGPIGLG